MQPPNIFADIPADLPAELIQPLLDAPNLRIERIISRGQASPAGFWYEQEMDEWVLLIAGAARLEFESERIVEMTAGSYIHIPARQRHRVAWTAPSQTTIWLAVHFAT